MASRLSARGLFHEIVEDTLFGVFAHHELVWLHFHRLAHHSHAWVVPCGLDGQVPMHVVVHGRHRVAVHQSMVLHDLVPIRRVF